MLNGDYDIVILVADITDATGWCIDFGADNVTFDGNGRVILGNGALVGIDFSNRHNVVVRNSVVLLFEYGIYGDFCHDVVVQENSVLLCTCTGVYLGPGDGCAIVNNSLARNGVDNQFGAGIELQGGTWDFLISGNTLTENWQGMLIMHAYQGVLVGNRVEGSIDSGIVLAGSDNAVYHNALINNGQHATDYSGASNVWDGGYAEGGNFWSGHPNIDEFCGPEQTEAGSDAICDQPYVTGGPGGAVDRYPLIRPILGPWNPCDLDFDGDVDFSEFETLAVCFSGPGIEPMLCCLRTDIDRDVGVDMADFALFQVSFTGSP